MANQYLIDLIVILTQLSWLRLYPCIGASLRQKCWWKKNKVKFSSCQRIGNSPLIGQSNYQSQSAHEEVAAKTNSAGLKTEEARKQLEEAPSKKISERRVTWNRGRRSSVNSNDVTQQDLPVRNQSNESYLLMPGGDVEKNSTSVQSLPSTSASNKSLITTSSMGQLQKTWEPMHQDPDDDSEEIRRNSSYSQSGIWRWLLTESGRFSRKLKSPRFRRKHPNNLQPSVSLRYFQDRCERIGTYSQCKLHWKPEKIIQPFD